MRSKLFVGILIAAAAVGACRKPPAGEVSAAGQTGAATASQPAKPAEPPKPVPAQLPEVIARVNGEEIKKAELDQIVKTMEARAGQPVPADRRDEIYRNAIDQLVVYKLLWLESKARGVQAGDAEIQAKLTQLRGQFPTQEAFDKALKDRGMTADTLKRDAQVDISVNKLMQAEVAALPGPSDADAKDFYDKNPDQFKQPEQARASHILIRVDPNATPDVKKKARAQIDSVLKQAKAGADFAKLAQEHSQDGSAAQGGDLNYFNRKMMVPEFDQAAFALQPGQISDVVTTQFGYHVIKVTDRKPERLVPFEEAQGKIKEFLAVQKKDERQKAFIEGLRKKAKIEVLV